MGFDLAMDLVPGVLGGGGGLTFLLDFVPTDYADQILTNGQVLTCRKGYLKHVGDANDDYKFSSGELQRNQLTSWADSFFVLSDSGGTPISLTRAAGTAFAVSDLASASVKTLLGFGPNANSPASIAVTSGGIGLYNNAVYLAGLPNLWSNGDNLCVILRNQGGFVIDADTGTLSWIVDSGQADTLYALASNSTGIDASLLTRWSIADLVANGYLVFDVRDLDLCSPGTGTGTSSIAAPVTGNTFVHTADFALSLGFDFTQGSGQDLDIRYRVVGANDFFTVYGQDSNGNLILSITTTAGGTVTLATSSGAIASGSHSLDVVVIDDSHEVFLDGDLKLSITNSNFLTVTNGIIINEASAASNLTARTLDGVANVSSSNHPGYGLATAVLPGPRAEDDSATRESGAWCEVIIPAIPSASTTEYAIRYVDASNYVYLEIDSAGNFDLREVTAGGGSTSLATNAAGISGGERLIFVDDGSSIKIYHDTTLAINYSTSLHNTATLTYIVQFGTGSYLSNAKNYPLDFSSASNTGGAADAATALALLGA